MVSGKVYTIVIELVLAVLALVIIWHVFTKLFGFGAGILSGFIEKAICMAPEKVQRGAGAITGGVAGAGGGAMAGCFIKGALGAKAGAAMATIPLPGIGTVAGAAAGFILGCLAGAKIGAILGGAAGAAGGYVAGPAIFCGS